MRMRCAAAPVCTRTRSVVRSQLRLERETGRESSDTEPVPGLREVDEEPQSVIAPEFRSDQGSIRQGLDRPLRGRLKARLHLLNDALLVSLAVQEESCSPRPQVHSLAAAEKA